MTRKEAATFIRKLIRRLGNGFHPDHDLDDYTDRENNPTFTDDELKELAPLFAQSWDVLGHDIYSVSLEMFKIVDYENDVILKSIKPDDLGEFQIAFYPDSPNREYLTKEGTWTKDRSKAACFDGAESERIAEALQVIGNDDVGGVLYWN